MEDEISDFLEKVDYVQSEVKKITTEDEILPENLENDNFNRLREERLVKEKVLSI